MEVENVRGSSLEERSATADNAPTLLVASRIMPVRMMMLGAVRRPDDLAKQRT
jgi:hypothetical protein